MNRIVVAILLVLFTFMPVLADETTDLNEWWTNKVAYDAPNAIKAHMQDYRDTLQQLNQMIAEKIATGNFDTLPVGVRTKLNNLRLLMIDHELALIPYDPLLDWNPSMVTP